MIAGNWDNHTAVFECRGNPEIGKGEKHQRHDVETDQGKAEKRHILKQLL